MRVKESNTLELEKIACRESHERRTAPKPEGPLRVMAASVEPIPTSSRGGKVSELYRVILVWRSGLQTISRGSNPSFGHLCSKLPQRPGFPASPMSRQTGTTGMFWNVSRVLHETERRHLFGGRAVHDSIVRQGSGSIEAVEHQDADPVLIMGLAGPGGSS